MLHRYIRKAELVAVALLAAAFSFNAALPHVLPKMVASIPDLVQLPTLQKTLPQDIVLPPKCTRGKPATAWGAWLVPADSDCFETAKAVGIVFRGPMQFGKAGAAFFKVVKEAGMRRIAFLRINSPGGDTDAGLAIGAWLHAHKDVRIDIPRWCASACSLAVLGAGPGRITLAPGARIAVHQSYNVLTGEVEASHNDMLVAFLRKAGVPNSTVAGMRRTPPDSAYIMTPDELKSYGIATS